jgi:hypothetical protein
VPYEELNTVFFSILASLFYLMHSNIELSTRCLYALDVCSFALGEHGALIESNSKITVLFLLISKFLDTDQ